ncbi:glycoside hydrolase family 6 protein [Streptomyces sp. NPDC006207]|nr:glycoside hydrolase family 6 protein [Streptomyces sp. PA03-5A]
MVLAAIARARRPGARTVRVVAGLAGAAVLLSPGWAAGPALAEAPPAAIGPSPFWADPDSRAARQADAWEARGRTADAALLRRIADQPLATWLDDRTQDAAGETRRITAAAERAHRIPVLVLHNLPRRDCVRRPTGAADAAAYRRWITGVSGGIGGRPAVVILEPDAVAGLVAGCGGAAPGPPPGRAALLAEAVGLLKARTATRVYLDAGNPGRVPDLRRLAAALRLAGIGRADGFALNVAGFHTTGVSTQYGDRLSGLLGGAHYVIDTSRNGKGPWAAVRRNAQSWCKPPDRALGPAPTVRTGSPLVDAYLWVKQPGESDGACRGAPPAGHWWAAYALELAREAGRRPAARALRPAPAVPTWTPSASAPASASAPPSVAAPAPASAPASAAVPSTSPSAAPSRPAVPG